MNQDDVPTATAHDVPQDPALEAFTKLDGKLDQILGALRELVDQGRRITLLELDVREIKARLAAFETKGRA